MKPTLILVNPWIYDFAAYDLWSKPLGLLSIAGDLRKKGFDIHLVDCLDVHHPKMVTLPLKTKPVRRLYGTGKFWKERISKPTPLAHISRNYNRYGITRQLLIDELQSVEQPAAILVTSLMTYWYPGVKEVIALAKEIHPGVPVLLGGIYARLCSEHALQYSGADYLMDKESMYPIDFIQNILKQYNVPVPELNSPETLFSYPAFDMQNKIDYVCIQTSNGCPYRCHYCASHFLNSKFTQREPEQVIEEIFYWYNDYGVRDFAFYDDALLVDSENHLSVILRKLIDMNLDLRFHTPNALHVREISAEIAGLLYLSGFRTLRLGLETSDIHLHDKMDKKISEGEFEKAIRNLKDAGFNKKEIGAYILMGLPGQSVESVEETLRFLGGLDVNPFLAEYSPLPHTQMWEKALAYSTHDILSEPLFHNNSLLICWDEDKRQRVPELKKIVQEIRQF